MSGTIYIPADRRAEQLGAALGQGVGAWNRQRVLGNAQNITDPTEQLNYLQSQLGPEGAEFIKNLMDLKGSQAKIAEAQANTERAKADTASIGTLNQLNQFKLSHAEDERQLEDKVKLAEIAHSRAAAAGDYARAAAIGQELAISREKLGLAKHAQDMSDMVSTAQIQELLTRGKQVEAQTKETETRTQLMPQQVQGELAVQKSTLDTQAATRQRETVQTKLLEDQLANAEKLRQMDLETSKLRNDATRASITGSEAQAREAGARADQLKVQADELRQRLDLSRSIINSLGIDGGQSKATPDSYSPELSGAPRAKPISTDTTVGDGRPKEISDGGSKANTSQDFSAKLQMIQAADQGKDPAPALPQKIQLTEGIRDEIIGALSKGDIAEAGRAIQKSQQPTQVFDNEIAPGITVKLGLYSDGQTRPIPGTVQDKRKPATPQLAQAATGAAQWFNTSQALKELSTNADNPKGDVLGSASVRRLDAWLQGHGLQPTGAANTRNIKEAYTSVYQHNIIGITSLLAGARQTQALRQQLQDTAARPTDTKELRDQKIAATEMTAQVFIKSEVETAIESGTHVPPALMEIYKQLGLDKQNLETLRQNYMGTISALGVKNPVDPLTGEVSTSSLKGGSGATIDIDGQAFPRADVEQRAKAKGMSVDEWINAVKSPAIPAKP